MSPLSARELLQIREWGDKRHPVDRALVILARGYPDTTWEDLSQLDLDRRNRMLLQLREHTLGPALDSIAVCPSCGEQLEFLLDTRALRSNAAPAPRNAYTTNIADLEIEYRPPNSLDLAAVAAAKDAEHARLALLQRVVLRAARNAEGVPVEDLSEEVTAALANQIADRWPLAEIHLNLQCPECSHEWQPQLDIPGYFWAEIESQAMRVVQDVHTLARAYGWSEEAILSMSSTRRRYYLDMVVT